MDSVGFFTKVKNWLILMIPAAVGFALAIVMRRKPAAPQEPAARHDMAQANANVEVLKHQQEVLEQQHVEIAEALKPKPVVEESLEDAVNRFNGNR